MKNFFTLCFWLLGAGFWQTTSAQSAPSPDKQNKQVTTQDAFYPKGDQALFTYIMNNVAYSDEAKKKYIEGNISLSFDVMPDSTVKNINIISDLGYGVGEGVKKLVEQLKFAPAVQMGMKVKMNLMMDFPVKAH